MGYGKTDESFLDIKRRYKEEDVEERNNLARFLYTLHTLIHDMLHHINT